MTTVAALLVVLRWDGRHEVDPAGRGGSAQARPGAAAAALADLVQAVDRRDHQAVPGASAAVVRVVHNARVLDVRDFTLRYVDEIGSPAADGSWSAEVEATWRFHGFDARPARTHVVLRFDPRPTGVVVRDVAAEVVGRTRAPLWLSEEVRTTRDDRVLVLVPASGEDAPGEAASLARDVRRALATVRASLPDWRGRLVVEQATSAAGLDRALGASPGTYGSIAAVTAPVGDTIASGDPVHVYLNPDLGSRMDDRGREVVLAHEVVHVATDAARSAAEPWLVEGFADYVALRDRDLPDTVALGRAIDDVRRRGVPRRLPGAEDFGASGGELQSAYEQAWLACRLVAQELGHAGLVELNERAGAGARVERLLARAGMPYDVLVRKWRVELRRLSG